MFSRATAAARLVGLPYGGGASSIRRLVWRAAFVVVMVAGSATAAIPGSQLPALPGAVAYSRQYYDPKRGSAQYGISVADFAGMERHQITPRPPQHNASWAAYNPVWSPDGARVAFVRDATNDSGVYVANRDGTDLRRVIQLPPTRGGPPVYPSGITDYPSWSSDGREVAYGNGPLYIAGSDGSNTRTLVSASTCSPVWSSEGRSLVYLADSEDAGCTLGDGLRGERGYRSLYRIDADGSNRRLLAKGSFSDAAWSPDGSQIAYTANCWQQHSPPEWTCSLFLMNADGSGKHQLAPGVGARWLPVGGEGWVEWLAEGTEVLWFSWGSQRVGGSKAGLYATNISTKRTRRLRTGDFFGLAGISRDATRIAVTRAVPASDNDELLVLAPSGGLLQRITVPIGWRFRNATVTLR